jgi:hypothetical protein
MDGELGLINTVVATASFPEYQVLAGDLGAVVEVYAAPTLSSSTPTARPARC